VTKENEDHQRSSEDSTMRALHYVAYGSPTRLSFTELAIPVPADNEVLIRVRASTVNRTDCGFLRGKPWIVRLFSGLLAPKAQVLGCEFSGDVVDVGRSVSEFKIGDRVVGFKDDDYGFGGHALYTTMSVSGMLTTVPDKFSYEEVAPALEGAHYVLHYLRSAGIGSGQSVLINGATGSIGSAAVQLCKALGANVTAVCATEFIDKVRGLGADEVIDYLQEDFTARSGAFDVIFDAVGKSSLGRCRSLLKEGGVYMSSELGNWCQNPLLALYTSKFGKHRVMFPIPVNRREDAEYLVDLMDRGLYRPLHDRTYDFSDIVDAFHYVETGMKVGNVVILMDPQEKL